MNVGLRTTLNLGPILRLRDGIPDDISKRMGKQAASDIGRRIRNLGVTVDLEKLDPNSEFTKIEKEKAGVPNLPLVLTGDMSEPSAWEVGVGPGRVALTLKGEHQAKWDNIVDIAERTGKNWNRAYGIGANEITGVMNWIKNWLKRLGVE